MKSPTTDFDVLDDIGAGLDGAPGTVDDEPVAPSATTHVCEDELDDGSICGESFDTPLALGRHRYNRHGYRAPKPDKSPKARKSASKPRAKKQPVQQAAETAQVTGDRAALYTSSLAFIGLIAYTAVPPVDDYDLSVWNAGAPGLAAALDEVGAINPAFRTGCDLVLGGGAGGAYVKLVLALAAIATPIAAHHGVLPAAIGERMGAQIGVAPAPEPPPPATESERTAPQSYDPNSVEDVMRFLGDVPPRVGADLNAMMMRGGGPTVVNVPTPPPSPHAQPGPGETDDGADGSERLNPEAVAVS